MISISDSLRDTARKIAGIELQCFSVNDALSLKSIDATAHVLGVNFAGIKTGSLIVLISRESAFDLSEHIISTAIGTPFSKSELTIELVNNTIGELANMAAGHYLRNNGYASGTDLFAPKVFDTAEVLRDPAGLSGLTLCEYPAHRFNVIFRVA